MSQESNNGLVRIFSARACAEPLEKAAALFEEQTGIHVAIDVCNRHCAEPVAEEEFESEDLTPVRFVPLVGEEGWSSEFPSWL